LSHNAEGEMSGFEIVPLVFGAVTAVNAGISIYLVCRKELDERNKKLAKNKKRSLELSWNIRRPRKERTILEKLRGKT
jgi:hypothetical protein